MTKEKVTEFVTRNVLGIDIDDRFVHQPAELEQRARETLQPSAADVYFEYEPTVLECLKELLPTADGTSNYFRGLFPPVAWISRYNVRWLLGDIVAGITIGLVVVPQAMAYALLAQLKPAYGLYTSFTGAVLYWLFGTSKDIVIGTTAVGSLLVGQVIARVEESHPDKSFGHEEIAHTLSLLCGFVLLFFGLFRLGWIIEFIPYIPISAFVTAASITIMSTQIPTALGLQGVDTSNPPYLVLIHTFKQLPTIRLDAAIGISSLVLLFAIKAFCARMEKNQPTQKRMWAFISSLRLTFTILLFTLISFLVNRTGTGSKFRIVGPISTGFREAGIPQPSIDLVKAILPELPAVAIILVIEHIAIAKSMGRLHNYTINPSQEIVALGGANLLSPFVGGYVCTGSFGASAVLSKAGSRTPLAGLFSAIVLVLALYALTGVFFYIPNAALAGLIIHAVCNLITPPKKVFRYWQLSPLDLCIWVLCMALALFKSLEYCIYIGVGLSIVVLFVSVARTRGQFLGKVRTRRVQEDRDPVHAEDASQRTVINQDKARSVFVPLAGGDGLNPSIKVETPYPGVFIYRLNEGYNYTNQAYHTEILLGHIMENTKRTSDEILDRESDRLWNDRGPRNQDKHNDALPYLRAIVLDFGAVNNVDITALQGLIDLRNCLDRYTYPEVAEWHFAGVGNRWTRRALATAGFGYPSAQNPDGLASWQPIYSIAETLMSNEATPLNSVYKRSDVETNEAARTAEPRLATVNGIDRPFFHLDLHDALQAAVKDARNKDKVDH